MQKAFDHWRKSISEPISLWVLALGCLLFTLAGPFGTQAALTIVDRFMLWAPIVVVGGALSLFVRICLRLWFYEVMRGWVETATVGLIVVLVGPLMLIWSGLVAARFGIPDAMPSNGAQLFYLAVTAGSFIWMRNAVIRVIGAEGAKRVAVADDANDPPETLPRLMRRVDADKVAPVLYLMADGHFVDVKTRNGTARIRMRLADAIDEMEGVDGFSTHRSYWVATGAIVGASRAGTVWRLSMDNGDEVPVSRKYQPLLEDAGLLRDIAAE